MGTWLSKGVKKETSITPSDSDTNSDSDKDAFSTSGGQHQEEEYEATEGSSSFPFSWLSSFRFFRHFRWRKGEGKEENILHGSTINRVK